MANNKNTDTNSDKINSDTSDEILDESLEIDGTDTNVEVPEEKPPVIPEEKPPVIPEEKPEGQDELITLISRWESNGVLNNRNVRFMSGEQFKVKLSDVPHVLSHSESVEVLKK